jgi:lipoic acid synthetase
MILGDTCTRACGFCAVRTGRPSWNDPDEPARIAGAIADLGIEYVVITSVTRDDLPDGGASIFAATIGAVRGVSPRTRVEVLVPDFRGLRGPIEAVVEARPDVFGHNIETVERLQRPVRRRARYERSLAVLRDAKLWAQTIGAEVRTKSALMVGLGETRDEIRAALRDLREVDCDFLTVGQYLRPTREQLPVVRYYEPAEFSEIGAEAISMGFLHVESAPLARSSYHAREYLRGRS